MKLNYLTYLIGTYLRRFINHESFLLVTLNSHSNLNS